MLDFFISAAAKLFAFAFIALCVAYLAGMLIYAPYKAWKISRGKD